MSESLSTAGAATLNTPPRSFSPAGCTACGNPDAACHPHGHGLPIEEFARQMEGLVVPEPNSGCCLWLGPVDRRGYGRVEVWRSNHRRVYRAHRVAWLLSGGDLVDGLSVLHRCDIRCCVNPTHLFLGTPWDNSRDMARKGRGSRSAKGLPYGARREANGRFSASVKVRGAQVHLGAYDTAEEASRVAQAFKDSGWRGESRTHRRPQKLTAEAVAVIRHMGARGCRQWKLAATHGIAQKTVSAILLCKIWSPE